MTIYNEVKPEQSIEFHTHSPIQTPLKPRYNYRKSGRTGRRPWKTDIYEEDQFLEMMLDMIEEQNHCDHEYNEYPPLPPTPRTPEELFGLPITRSTTRHIMLAETISVEIGRGFLINKGDGVKHFSDLVRDTVKRHVSLRAKSMVKINISAKNGGLATADGIEWCITIGVLCDREFRNESELNESLSKLIANEINFPSYSVRCGDRGRFHTHNKVIKPKSKKSKNRIVW